MADATVEEPGDDSRARVIRAAGQLLAEGGSAAVTTRAVAGRAGVQPPTIYRLFGDKDGLIRALAQEAFRTYVARKQQMPDTPSGDDPAEALRAAWRSHIDFGLANPELYALIGDRAGEETAELVSGIAVLRGHVRRLAAAGVLVVSEQRAVEMIHAAGTGAVRSLLEQRADERDEGLADALFDAVLVAIAPESASPRPAASAALPTAVQFAAVLDAVPALSPAERALLGEWLHRVIAHEQDAAASATD